MNRRDAMKSLFLLAAAPVRDVPVALAAPVPLLPASLRDPLTLALQAIDRFGKSAAKLADDLEAKLDALDALDDANEPGPGQDPATGQLTPRFHAECLLTDARSCRFVAELLRPVLAANLPVGVPQRDWIAFLEALAENPPAWKCRCSGSPRPIETPEMISATEEFMEKYAERNNPHQERAVVYGWIAEAALAALSAGAMLADDEAADPEAGNPEAGDLVKLAEGCRDLVVRHTSSLVCDAVCFADDETIFHQVAEALRVQSPAAAG